MIIDKSNPKHLIADDGKVLLRMVGMPVMRKEIMLSTIVLNGDTIEDKAENYQEVDAPKGHPLAYAIKLRKEARK